MKLYDVIVTQKQVGVVSVWANDEAEALAEGQRYARCLEADGRLSFEYTPDLPVAAEAAEGDSSVRREDFDFNLAYPKE